MVDCSKQAAKHGRKPEQVKRDRPLNVSGVGNGSQQCTHDCKVPVAIKTSRGILSATYQAPTVPNSNLPALLGLETCRRQKAIIDTHKAKMYLLGPGDYDLEKLLPQGTECIDLKTAPSGHFVIPCTRFTELDHQDTRGGLTTEELSLPVDPPQQK